MKGNEPAPHLPPNQRKRPVNYDRVPIKWGIPIVLWFGLLFGLLVYGVDGFFVIGLIAIVSLLILLWINHSVHEQLKKRNLQFEELAEKDHQERVDAQQAEDQRKKSERDQEREGKLQPFLDFGFEIQNLESTLARRKAPEVALDEDGNERSFAEVIARALLEKDSPNGQLAAQVTDRHRAKKSHSNHLFSFGFGKSISNFSNGLSPKRFADELQAAFKKQISQQSGHTLDADSDRDQAIAFEIWYHEKIPTDRVLFCHKTRMKGNEDVHFIARPLADHHFNIWEQPNRGAWRCRSAPYFYAASESTFTFGPRLERFQSAVVDFWTSGVEKASVVSFDEIHDDTDLKKTIGIESVKQFEPFPFADVYQCDRKGYIEVRGWFVNGKWEPWEASEDGEPMPKSDLAVSAPNIFVQPFAFVGETGASERNSLLGRFIAGGEVERHLKTAISTQEGNFEIRRGPINHSSQISKYFIRRNDTATTTEFFYPSPGQEEHFKNADAYTAFPDPRSHASPLEDEGFCILSASSGYLKTGNENIQWVLFVDFGSPAPSQNDLGVHYANFDLEATLFNYAESEAIENVELLGKGSAQGIVGVGEQNGETVYVKIPDPTLSIDYGLIKTTRRLIDSHVLPDAVKIDRVDTYGQKKSRMIPVFTMPEYRSVADVVAELPPDDETARPLLLKIVEELAIFTDRILKQDILCTDFTLPDTFVPVPDAKPFLDQLAEYDPAAETSEDVRLFVGDVGSYLNKAAFTRDDTITREQYMPPEHENEALAFEAEPYQIFQLGILFVEVVTAQPNTTLDAVKKLKQGISQTEYTAALETELAERLPDDLSNFRKMVEQMLAFDPADRITIAELIQS